AGGVALARGAARPARRPPRAAPPPRRARRAPPAPAAPAAAPPAPAARPDGAAGMRVEEIGIVRPPGQRQAAPPEPTGRASADEARARGRGDLAGGSRGVITPPPPRPRGLSVSSRPSVGGPPAANPSQPPAQAATAERPAPA